MGPKAQEEVAPSAIPLTPESPKKIRWDEQSTNKPKRLRKKQMRRRDTLTDLMEATNQDSYGFIKVAWYFIMATSGLFDFLSVFLPAMFLGEMKQEQVDGNDSHTQNLEEENLSFFGVKTIVYEKGLSGEREEEWYMSSIEWLRDNGATIYMFFAVLWFVNSFVNAYHHRQVVLKDLDRQRLLALKISSSPLRESVIKREEEAEAVEWTTGAWSDYWHALVFQLVLLPVGFYILTAHLIEAAVRKDVDFDSDKEVVFYMPEGNNNVPEYEHKLSTHSHQSLVFALMHYVGMVVQRMIGLKKNDLINVVKPKIIQLGKRIAFRGIRNPKRFWKRVQKILKVVRWVKYLAPLIGSCNKLLGNCKDLLIKWRQSREAAIALKFRQHLFRKLEGHELRERAAIIIQSRWRAHVTQKNSRALKILMGQKEALMAIKVQRVMKGMLARARVRLLEKEAELKRLHNELEVAVANHEEYRVSVRQRQRMYKLEAELGRECKEMLNKKLLMRPNTRFAVVWKCLFIICVMLEIAQLAVAPMLQQYKDEETHQPLLLHQVIEQKLLPTPIEEWDACLPKFKPEPPKKGLAKLFEKMKSPQKVEKEEQEIPWYCNSPFPEAQTAYAEGVKFVIREFLIFVGVVCFLDVFVTFFTGELDEEGFLKPKPFFTRWIIPGLVLQLLVNPKMVNVSKWVVASVKSTVHVGPVRIARWSIAFFIPVTKLIIKTAQLHFWIPFVKKENKNTPPQTNLVPLLK
mmetsp:Transcript_1728/g.2391  ORF Transcript_1728/g.2391 Transcript_1728/m.2391 type:complete len:744 (+) Transcript_1728:153-2384(+)